MPDEGEANLRETSAPRSDASDTQSTGSAAPPTETPESTGSAVPPAAAPPAAAPPVAAPRPAPPANALAAFVLDMDEVEALRAAEAPEAAGQPANGAQGPSHSLRRRSMTPEAVAAYAEAYGRFAEAEERLALVRREEADAQARREAALALARREEAAGARRDAARARPREPFYSVERPTGRVLVAFAVPIVVVLGAAFIAIVVCAIIMAFRWFRG